MKPPPPLPTLLIALSILASGCRSAPEPPTAAPLAVEVAVDGRTLAPLDAAWLDAHPTDMPWGNGRAWRLTTLFGDAFSEPGRALEVTGSGGELVTFPDPAARPDGLEPVFVVNRRGETIVTLAEPGRRDGRFHGRGGARNRPADASIRVVGVTRLHLEKRP